MRTRSQLATPAVTPLEVDDARALALEVAGLRPPGQAIDAAAAGVVLAPDERAFRVVGLWLRMRSDGRWSEAAWATVIVTDQRLLARLPLGELVSLWWGSLMGFDVDLANQTVILDYGDGFPRLVAGPSASVVAVVGVAQLYGPQALTTHPGLAMLRS